MMLMENNNEKIPQTYVRANYIVFAFHTLIWLFQNHNFHDFTHPVQIESVKNNNEKPVTTTR